MTYSALRTLHLICVTLSISGFFLRGLLMLRDSPLLQDRLTRTLPHINDTILLATGISLMAWSGQYPWVSPWLTAKIAGLLLYILVGAFALRRGKTKRSRTTALCVAIIIIGWMVSVAQLRNPAGFFGLIWN
jgi:uncharacterized membrane protein SirB2